MEFYYGWVWHKELTSPEGRLVMPEDGETLSSLLSRGYCDSPTKAGLIHPFNAGNDPEHAKSIMRKVEEGLIPRFDALKTNPEEEARRREAEEAAANEHAEKMKAINEGIRAKESHDQKIKESDEKLKDWKNDEGTLDSKGKHNPKTQPDPVDGVLPDLS